MKIQSQTFMIMSIAVLATTLILSSSHAVYAMKSLGENPSISRVGPQHFGLTTKGIVCGDKLCKDTKVKTVLSITPSKFKNMMDNPSHTPTIETGQVFHSSKQTKDAYNAVFKVTAGDKDLGKLQIFAHSDMEQKIIPINGLFAKSSQVVQVRIHAQDPQSIGAVIGSWNFNS